MGKTNNKMDEREDTFVKDGNLLSNSSVIMIGVVILIVIALTLIFRTDAFDANVWW